MKERSVFVGLACETHKHDFLALGKGEAVTRPDSSAGAWPLITSRSRIEGSNGDRDTGTKSR